MRFTTSAFMTASAAIAVGNFATMATASGAPAKGQSYMSSKRIDTDYSALNVASGDNGLNNTAAGGHKTPAPSAGDKATMSGGDQTQAEIDSATGLDNGLNSGDRVDKTGGS